MRQRRVDGSGSLPYNRNSNDNANKLVKFVFQTMESQRLKVSIDDLEGDYQPEEKEELRVD